MYSPSSAEFKSLVFRIQNEVGALPEAVAVKALRDSFRRFVRESEAWRVVVTFSVSKDTTSYEAVGNYDAELLRVLSVRLRTVSDGRAFNAVSPIGRNFYTVSGANVVFPSDGRLNPYDGGTCCIESALGQLPSSENLDEMIVKRYSDGLVSGAVADIRKQFGRPWFSAELAAVAKQEFNVEVSRAIADSHSRGRTESENSFIG